MTNCDGAEPGCCVAHDWGRHLAESAPDAIPDDLARGVLSFIDGVSQIGIDGSRLGGLVSPRAPRT